MKLFGGCAPFRRIVPPRRAYGLAAGSGLSVQSAAGYHVTAATAIAAIIMMIFEYTTEALDKQPCGEMIERKSLTRHAIRGRFSIRLTTLALLATPYSRNAQLAFLRIGRVRTLEDYTGDAGVTES